MADRKNKERHHAGTAGPRGGIGLVTAGLIAFGLYHLALGVFMVVAPGTFFAEIGPFGVRNDHYIRDTATYNLALAAGLIASIRLRSWRVPVLTVVLIQFGLHAINHLVDIGEADPEWIGVLDFVSLTIGALLLAALLAAAARNARAQPRGQAPAGGAPTSGGSEIPE